MGMEITLNLCWLAMVAAAYTLWLRHPQYRGHQLRSRRERLAAALVLSCALFLVFPVISISDDVRAAREFLEEPSSDQPLAKSLEVQKRVSLGQLPTPVAAVIHPAPVGLAWRSLGNVFIAEIPAREPDPASPVLSRSPPQA